MHKLIEASVFAAIGVLVFASLLIPVVDEATATTITYENEGYYYLEKYTGDYTFSWDRANPSEFIVNGETVTYTNTTTLSQSIILGVNFAVRIGQNNPDINFYGSGVYINTSATNPTFTATYSEGSITVTNGTNSRTISNVDEIYSISKTGNYVMKNSNAIAYLNSGSEVIADSQIYASGQTFNGNVYIFWHLDGTINDINYPDEFNSTITITNQDIHGRYSTDCLDLYELENITFTATTSYQEGVVYNITASYFVVPATVTAEKAIHADEPTRDILAVLPLILICALIMGVVGYVIYSRIE